MNTQSNARVWPPSAQQTAVVRHLDGRDFAFSIRSLLRQWSASCFQKKELKQLVVRLVAVGHVDHAMDPDQPTLSVLVSSHGYERLIEVELITVDQPHQRMVDIRFTLPQSPMSDAHMMQGQGKWVVETDLTDQDGSLDQQRIPVPFLSCQKMSLRKAI